MKRTLTLFICLFCIQKSLNAQKYKRQDTIRGSITSERSWWDLNYYDLEVSVNPKSKTIDGKNSIHYKVLKTNNSMQIDLQPPMQLTKAIQNGWKLKISHCGNAHYIHLEKTQIKYKKRFQIVPEWSKKTTTGTPSYLENYDLTTMIPTFRVPIPRTCVNSSGPLVKP